MHGYLNKLMKDLEISMENKGDKLVVTMSGDKDKLKTLEKKLNAMKELCLCGDDCDCGDDCECGDDCKCGDKHHGCCC